MRDELTLQTADEAPDQAHDGYCPVKGKLRKVHCCVCGIKFGITAALRKQRLKDGRDFYCPNGHRQHFTGDGAGRLQAVQRHLARTIREKEHLEARLDSCRTREPEDEIQESRASWSFGFWRAFRSNG